MYFYYIVLLIVVLIYLFSKSLPFKDKKKAFINMSFLFLIIVAGIRGYECGGDLRHYLVSYEMFGKEDISDLLTNRTKYGYIFALLCKLGYSINPSRTSFLFVSSIVSLVPVGIFIYRYSPKPLLSVFIFITFAFYTNTFNSVRACMALGICLMLMPYVIKRQWWKFLIGFLFAFEVHQTVLPFVLVYFLQDKKINYKRILIPIVASFVMTQALKSLLPFLQAIAYMYDPGAYSSDAAFGDSYSGGYNLLMLVFFMTLGFYYMNRDRLMKCQECDDKRLSHSIQASPIIHIGINSMIIASCILCFSTMSTEFTRLSYFFTIQILLLIPISLQHIKKTDFRAIAKYCCVLFFLAYFKIFVMTPNPDRDNSNASLTLPYYTYWQKK